MKQMEYFEKVTYQNTLYTGVCVKNATLSKKQNGCPREGHYKQMGNIPCQEFSCPSFSQQYLPSAYYISALVISLKIISLIRTKPHITLTK